MNSNKVWGGGEKWHYETARYLLEHGYPVAVVANHGSEFFNKVAEHPEIILRSYRINNFSFLNPFMIFRLRKWMVRNNVKAVVLGLSIDVKLGGLAAKLAGVDHIIYRRGSAVPVKNSVLNRFLFSRVLTKVITNSKEISKSIFRQNRAIIDPNNVEIIYNGINLENWPDPVYFMNGENENGVLKLGNAGRLVEQKGQEYLIRIAKRLKDAGIPFRLFIAGSGRLEKKLKAQCLHDNLEKDVVFMDFVDDISELLKDMDIYLSTSLHEGSSHVIIESMAAGKPVIAFDISSLPEMVNDGETGFLVPFGNEKMFAEKITYLWKHPGEMKKMGANARKLVEERFDFNKNIRKVLDLIEE